MGEVSGRRIGCQAGRAKKTEGSASMTHRRVIAYIDGFNLFYGMREKGWKRYYWLDIAKLAGSLLKPGQELVAVDYFTTRISGHNQRTREKAKRQSTYLEAVATLEAVTTYFGHYLAKSLSCLRCGNRWDSFEEKMTDVNIATELLTDAVANRFDAALVVSGDSDLAPPIQRIKDLHGDKKVVSVFPPARSSAKLKRTAHAYFTIGETHLRNSMFPDEVKKPDGFVLKRPAEWRQNTGPRR